MSLLRDVRFALRSFRLAPAAAFVTALTIAIGVGATTTVLSVADALLPFSGLKFLAVVEARRKTGEIP